jgi:hypothetical protein
MSGGKLLPKIKKMKAKVTKILYKHFGPYHRDRTRYTLAVGIIGQLRKRHNFWFLYLSRAANIFSVY